MSISDIREQLAAVPLRLVFKHSPEKAAARGTVLFFHGFMASIADQGKELWSLAEEGYLAVGVDCVGHGQRRYADFEARFHHEHANHSENYRQLLRDSVSEIPGLVDVLFQRSWAQPGKLAAIGISMGGMICYGAILAEPRLSVLMPILGSPRWHEQEAMSPHRHGERFYPVALLAQNAGEDVNVPPEAAREFHAQLRPFYEDKPERLGYIEFPGCGHFMPEAAWNELWRNCLDWLERML